LRTARVVLCGDSLATSYGSGDGIVPYPTLVGDALGESNGRDRVVQSRARAGTTVHLSARSVESIVHMRPEVVVLAHGGGECILAASGSVRRLLRLLGRAPRNNLLSPASIASVRQPIVFGSSGRWMLTTFAGIRPVVAPSEFAVILEWTVRSLIQGSGVDVLLVVPCVLPSRRTYYDPKALEANRASMTALGSALSGVRTVDTAEVLTGPWAFGEDKCHFSQAGHAAVAGQLVEVLSTSDASADPDGSDTE